MFSVVECYLLYQVIHKILISQQLANLDMEQICFSKPSTIELVFKKNKGNIVKSIITKLYFCGDVCLCGLSVEISTRYVVLKI